MTNGTVITITNLPDELGALLGGVTSVVLDIDDEFSIRLSKTVEQLSILNKISTEAALGFSVPFSPTNDRVFAEYATPLTLDVKTVFFQCHVIVDGHPLQFSRLFVRGKSERNREWELELARSPDHWVELASQVKTNDLDFGTFQMTKTNIVNSWATPAYDGDYTDISVDKPVAWPLVDYGGWCDQTQPPQNAPFNLVRAVGVEDFRPWLSWLYILRAGFCKIGWTLESVLFELEVVKRLWVYALRSDYYIASEKQLGGRVTGQIYTRSRYNQSDELVLENVTVLADYAVIDNSNFPVINRFCGIKNYPGISLNYRFFFKGEFHNDRALPFTAFFSVMEIEDTGSGYFFTGEVLSTESLQVDFAPNEKQSVTFEQTVTLKPGQMAAINIPVRPTSTPGFFVEPGFYFEVTPANQSYMTDDIIDVRLSVSDDMSILDWLKAFIQPANGKLTTDWETKTVTIFSNKTANVWGEISPGFLLREDPVIDIDELVVPGSINLKPVRPDLKRFTRFGFKAPTDAYIKSLNLSEPPHSRKLLNSVELPNAVEEILNPFIEPTLEGKIGGLIGSGSGGRQPRPFVARLWDNTDGARSFALAPRVLYAYGNVRQINPAPINATNELTSFFFDKAPNPSNTGLVTNFGYFTQSPTWAMTPTPTVVVDFVFGIKSVDLFTIFHLGYTQDARSGTIADLLMLMAMGNYQSYNFRQLFRFKIRGIPVIAPMVSIRDFSSAERIPTPVQFFVEPATLECCDLPCGCQFIECEYYQDMSAMMRQSTLDDLKIASFVVDGVELVSTPVSFGVIKIIDIGGKPYVTNMVDVLNSIGAPYFSFNYSTREEPGKGLRFFKLKRLACFEFRILITDSGSDAYEYTHDSQQQNVFGGGWNDFGYPPTHGTPENCLTTTEY